MNDVQNREDVSKVVRTFYMKVRADEALGPIFNNVITDWEEHLEKLTDFWTMNLFGGKLYSGNPIIAHQHTDSAKMAASRRTTSGLGLAFGLKRSGVYMQGKMQKC